MKISPLLFGGLFLSLAATPAFATNYTGNGASGFNGSVGSATLSVTYTPNAVAANSTYTFTLATGNGQTSPGGDNGFALYIDSIGSSGFANTSTLHDNGDGGRTVVSGYSASGAGDSASQATVVFPTGFGADFGISFQSTYVGMFGLSAGGNQSLNYITGTGQSGSTPFTLTVTAQQLGITTANAPIRFVGSLTSTSAFRSNEAIGTATITSTGASLPASANPGFNSSITFSNVLTFNPVPEPGTVVGLGFGAAALALGWRRARRA